MHSWMKPRRQMPAIFRCGRKMIRTPAGILRLAPPNTTIHPPCRLQHPYTLSMPAHRLFILRSDRSRFYPLHPFSKFDDRVQRRADSEQSVQRCQVLYICLYTRSSTDSYNWITHSFLRGFCCSSNNYSRILRWVEKEYNECHIGHTSSLHLPIHHLCSWSRLERQTCWQLGRRVSEAQESVMLYLPNAFPSLFRTAELGSRELLASLNDYRFRLYESYTPLDVHGNIRPAAQAGRRSA